MKQLLAQQTVPLDPIGGQPAAGFGPWGNIGLPTIPDVTQAANAFTSTMSQLIGVLTIIAGIWFIFNFMAGGYAFMTAGGSEDGIKKATAKITQSLIGLVVVVAAYAIISLVSELLGFPDLLQPQKMIQLLKP